MLETFFRYVIVTIVKDKFSHWKSLSSVHLVFVMICAKLFKSSLVVERDVGRLKTRAEVRGIFPVILVIDACVWANSNSYWYIYSMSISDDIEPLSFILGILVWVKDSEVMLACCIEEVGVLGRILSVISLYVWVPLSYVAQLIEYSVLGSDINENRRADFDFIVNPSCELVSNGSEGIMAARSCTHNSMLSCAINNTKSSEHLRKDWGDNWSSLGSDDSILTVEFWSMLWSFLQDWERLGVVEIKKLFGFDVAGSVLVTSVFNQSLNWSSFRRFCFLNGQE